MKKNMALSHMLATVQDHSPDELERLLEVLHDLQHANPLLFQGSRFKIQKKGQNEQSRFKYLLEYRGPDEVTLQLLKTREEQWSRHPSQFWSHPSRVSDDRLCPQAELRMACIVLVDLRKELNDPPINEVANSLHMYKIFPLSLSDLGQKIANMIDAGHRYKNMERALNDGICFLLGISLKESYWKKLVGKSGPQFDSAMERIRSIGVAEDSKKYTLLRRAVVQERLQQLQTMLISPLESELDCQTYMGLASSSDLYQEALAGLTS